MCLVGEGFIANRRARVCISFLTSRQSTWRMKSPLTGVNKVHYDRQVAPKTRDVFLLADQHRRKVRSLARLSVRPVIVYYQSRIVQPFFRSDKKRVSPQVPQDVHRVHDVHDPRSRHCDNSELLVQPSINL